MTRALSPAPAGLINSIEQFDAATLELDQNDCPNTRVPYLVGRNAAKKAAVIFRPRCKQWSCPVCGKSNAWSWAFRANDGAHKLYDAGFPLDFVAITSHEKLTPGASWWIAPKAWMKLQARIRRKVKTFEYLAVPEVQKNGRVHFHLITSARLSKKWWKDNARACGFGFMSDRKEVYELGGVVGYMAKYLVKAVEITSMPKHTRRVRTSRGFPKSPPKEPSDEWEFMTLSKSESVQDMAEYLKRGGFFVAMKGSKSSWRFVDAIDQHAGKLTSVVDNDGYNHYAPKQ